MEGSDITSAMKAVSQTDAGDAVAVNIICSSASKFSVQVNLDSTVLSFKAILARNRDIPADQQCLIYKGRILKDDQTLQSYGFEANHTVHLVRRFAPTTSATTNNAARSSSSGGLKGHWEQEELLAHILNDPAAIHRTLEAARNPELMREMLRNSDRAKSNIESSPEGFNTLRRIYETVQEPFMNATTLAGITGNGGTDPFTALLGSQGGNQVSDRSTNQSSLASGITDSPAPNTNPLPNPWSSSAGGGAQTNSTRSDPSADSRPQAPAGGQVLALSPQLQSLVGSNSQLTELMQNSQSLCQLTSPEMMQMRASGSAGILAHWEPAHTGGGAGTLNNMGLEALRSMFAGLGAGSLAVPNGSDVPPEDLYATQLLQLHEMGFIDSQENVRALIASSGNVHAAVEQLLGNHGQ
ncbi:hypothetical protein F3Y22_tig00110812pilonHSYRG00100 [Hibiscus syriacus]|uniref:Ubiquitin domain-containing protein DSK2b n=1 Tax=Hibiscus syriacus TaxID=106335 RepID=A0A6A2ZNT5_HIBSY|nr:hypothetical protein F3Y22_tig00110812pilonHSYRG00100 [Hibiscus syriacus]